MAFPPLESGGKNVATIVWFPGVSARAVGVPGIVYGIIVPVAGEIDDPAALSEYMVIV
jgi:hypothetical protein